MNALTKIIAWHAFSGALPNRDDLYEAFKNAQMPTFVENEIKAEAKNIPPMQRRRLSPLGRAVAESLNFPWPQTTLTSAPWVMASRWGDVGLSIQELQNLANKESISPSIFATTVHNGIAGLLSIAFGQHNGIDAVANADATAEAALMSATAYLTETPYVFVVFYEGQWPKSFGKAPEQSLGTHAIALLLARPENPLSGVLLELKNNTPEHDWAQAPRLSTDVFFDFFCFLFSSQTQWEHTSHANRWLWTKSSSLTKD